LAVTVLPARIVTVQVMPETESQPLHPVKMESKPVGAAVSVTIVLTPKSAEHVDPQLIPAGLDITEPLARSPVLFAVNGTVTVKIAALVAVPPGVVTLRGPVVPPAGTVA
jgi:hypothetical protein